MIKFVTQFRFSPSVANNGNHGFQARYSSFNNCVAYDNINDGFYVTGDAHELVNCVSDNNGDAGVYADIGPVEVIGCRITNNVVAFQGDGDTLFLDFWNFIKGNTSVSSNCTVIPTVRGQSTRRTTGTIGYVDRDQGDYSLTDKATARRIEIAL